MIIFPLIPLRPRRNLLRLTVAGFSLLALPQFARCEPKPEEGAAPPASPGSPAPPAAPPSAPGKGQTQPATGEPVPGSGQAVPTGNASPVPGNGPQTAPLLPGGYARRLLKAAKLPATDAPPVIDGDLKDPAWKAAATALSFVDPQSGKPVGDQTEAYLLYDSKYLYVAFRCHDSQPGGVVARETVRDADLNDDDSVTLELDPFQSYRGEDAARFTVNPLGTKHTQMGGGRAGKLEWQGDWDAGAQRTPDGWTAEMRIPWGILSYPRKAGAMSLGINFRRQQQRAKLESFWSDIGPQGYREREGVWQGVEAPTRAWRSRLSFLPYLLPSAQYGDRGRTQTRIGVDARYQPTPELTAVGTFNPDFASVEGAVESIGFSRSERYVPDRRPFFLDGRNYFQLGEDYELGLLFYPNRIDSVDAGAKLYGKITPQTTLGLLSTIAPGKQSNTVAHLRREFSPFSGVNLMLLQRLAPGEDNTVGAVGTYWRSGKWTLNGKAVQTIGPDAGGMAWTSALDLEDKNLFATIRYRRVGASFNDRLGYIPFNDFKGWSSYVHWGADWRRGALRNFGVDFSPNFDWHINGQPFRRRASLGVGFETRSDYRFGINVEGGKFDAQNDLTYNFNIGGGVSNRFRRWNLDFTTGIQADAPYTSVGPSVSLRLFRRLDVSVGSFLQSYQGASSQHIGTFNYEFSPYRALGGRVVISEGKVNAYVSYRNAGRGGLDTYFIIGDPNAPRFVKRVMMKMVFAL